MLAARSRWHHTRRSCFQAVRHHATASRHAPERDLNAILAHDASAPTTASGGIHDGPLSGKTIAIKDNIATAAPLPTTAASRVLHAYTSPFPATVTRLLQQAGATVSHKTNLDEFGMGSHTQASAAGPTRSPFARSGVPLSPGGSSGGSAVAVATGACYAALGTDTGGSVRLPAAYCGVVGFKPSYGLVSRWGVVAYANSLDTVGVLAARVEGARAVFGCVKGWDARDPTSLPERVRQRMEGGREGRRTGTNRDGGCRVGVPVEYNIAELSPVVRAAYARTLNALQAAGHSLHPVSLPTTRHALSTYYVLAPAEASSNLAKYDGVRYGRRPSGPDSSPAEKLPLYARARGDGFGDEVKRRVLLGAYTLSSEARDNYFVQAQRVRRLVQRDFDGVFASPHPLLYAPRGADQGVDVLLTPTAPTLPPTVLEVERQRPVERYMNDVFTVPASLAGLPAVSLPMQLTATERAGMEAGDVRSVGMQVVGQFGDDERVLDVAQMIEELQRQGGNYT